MHSLVCNGPGRKPERWFSHDAAQMQMMVQIEVNVFFLQIKVQTEQTKMRPFQEEQFNQGLQCLQ